MHINFKLQVNWSLLCLVWLITSLTAEAQVVWEDPRNSIHPFLSRQAQKGNIELTDFILPMSRKDIAMHLATLSNPANPLSKTEQAELEFFQREYAEFREGRTDTSTFFKKDAAGRWRFLSVDKEDFLLRGDPILGFETIQGQGKSNFKRTNGMQFWGHVLRNLTFQGYFSDITENGTGIDTLKQFTNETGIIRTTNIRPDAKTLNYTELKGNVTYNWKSGSVSVGKDHLLLGYGENGRVIMSDKAPAYPFIRLDYQPLPWLRFHYAHAWLQSGIIDSARTYPKENQVYGNDRELFASKFIATHSLHFFPVKGLALTVGESMVYSDRLDVGYLIPVMFFKAYDQYASRYKITTGSNGQFFLQASSRNHIRGTHLYGSLFIDEIRTSAVFNKAKSRNQLGFNLGASVTDLFVPYLTIGYEYTRLNPFVYQNLIPAQSYSSQNYNLGDWIGQNADRSTAWISYHPLPRLRTSLQLNYIRKGPDGSVEDQYYAEPQPPFLGAPVTAQKQLLLDIRYELINNLRIRAAYLKQAGVIRPTQQPAAVPNEIHLGISFGF